MGPGTTFMAGQRIYTSHSGLTCRCPYNELDELHKFAYMNNGKGNICSQREHVHFEKTPL